MNTCKHNTIALCTAIADSTLTKHPAAATACNAFVISPLQLTGELVSQQGIVLGRTTRTWVPKPRALAFRVFDFFICGPWRALGLKDDTVRVQLPLFEGFQNPQPPPGGWGSVAGLNPTKGSGGAAAAGECSAPGTPGMPSGSSSSKGSRVTGPEGMWAAAAAADGDESMVAGPRAMWLRVTMIGRSAGYGPPKVYRAAAHLHTQLSECCIGCGAAG